ncbi:hypothetical protein GCM10027594_34270 [Hymenobacter agri]
MALKLTFAHDSALLNQHALPSQTLYVRAGGVIANTITNTGYLPLAYKVMDENGQPSGDWLQGLGQALPATAPIMRPRELMMQENTTTYRQAYAVASEYLHQFFGDQATVEDLL